MLQENLRFATPILVSKWLQTRCLRLLNDDIKRSLKNRRKILQSQIGRILATNFGHTRMVVNKRQLCDDINKWQICD